MELTEITKLEQVHIACWNERDREKRDNLLREIYHEDIKMFDKDFTLTGIAEISDFIDKLLKPDPNFLFSGTKEMQQTQDGIRLFWEITAGPSSDTFTGMDFFRVEDGKVKQLYVFMDL